MVLKDHFARPVRGAILADDQFEAAARLLGEDAVDRGTDPLAVVVGDHQDTHPGCRHQLCGIRDLVGFALAHQVSPATRHFTEGLSQTRTIWWQCQGSRRSKTGCNHIGIGYQPKPRLARISKPEASRCRRKTR